MEEKVGEWEERPVGQRLNLVRSGLERGDVAVGTAHRRKQYTAHRHIDRDRPPRWRGEKRHEVREVFNTCPVVIEALRRLELQGITVPSRTILLPKMRAGHAHLVQIGVARELKECRHLSLPAEFPDR